MKHGAKMAFDCLKLAQDGRKLDPRWPKIGPRRGQKGDNAKLYVEGSYQPPFRTVLQGAAEDARKTSWSEFADGTFIIGFPSSGRGWDLKQGVLRFCMLCCAGAFRGLPALAGGRLGPIRGAWAGTPSWSHKPTPDSGFLCDPHRGAGWC